MNRRTFLKRSAALAVPVLAGCLESGPGGDPNGGSSTRSRAGSTRTPRETPTATDAQSGTDAPRETDSPSETDAPEGADDPTGTPEETDTPDSEGSNESRLAARTLEVTTARARRAADPTIEFDGDAVVVEGTITGNDHCYTAELDDVSHHDGELDVLVSAVDEGGDEACAQEVIEIEYRATFEFEGSLPAAVVVRHDSMGDVETVARASR